MTLKQGKKGGAARFLGGAVLGHLTQLSLASDDSHVSAPTGMDPVMWKSCHVP